MNKLNISPLHFPALYLDRNGREKLRDKLEDPFFKMKLCKGLDYAS